MSNTIPTFTIQSLFENNDSYVIPIYQRNYTWGLGEITQLIQDVYDYAFDDKKSTVNYYIGTLVVYERNIDGNISYETIDGQQRLTTLNILLNALHRVFKDEIKTKIKYQLNLNFDSREKSTETLEIISNHHSEKGVSFIPTKEYNSTIKQRYYDAEKVLKRFLDTPEKVNIFYAYLTQKVTLVRVSVPKETDLNHYFEIMNNRGEQLEKHEILKANMLEVLKDRPDLSLAFDTIWKACEDMERYVQYGFTPSQRHVIFSQNNWNKLTLENIEENNNHPLDVLASYLHENLKYHTNTNKLKVTEIVDFKGDFDLNSNEKEDAPERFNSVINFSNFLLHVLRIQTKKDIPLDDKRLIDAFEPFLKENGNKFQFVIDFGFNLLKTKHLFDQFIIKREFIREKDQWSLKRLKWYEKNKISYVNTFEENEQENKKLLMLLSMFHVSTPTLVYKHWLNASLYFLFYEENLTSQKYINYLQNLAKSFLFDRYTAINEPIDFYEIIYKNNAVSKNFSTLNYSFDKLDKGTEVENFAFNYLDYILWTENVKDSDKFEFTFRSSVEHYYPQNPITKQYLNPPEIIHLFGNLCLISSSKNSKLSNNMPYAKKNHYSDVGADSLKQRLMMEKDSWKEEEIKCHGNAMKEKFKTFNNAF